MAYKFRKWRIKWNPRKRKFKKHRRSRQASRKAHVRFIRNRGKMKQALRKSRIRGKMQRRKNKAMGIYKKLALARKRFKNILKSDMNLDMFFDVLDESIGPEVELDVEDLDGIKAALANLKDNVEFEGDDADEYEKEFKQFIDDALIYLEEFENIEQLEDEDREFLAEVLSFIEEYAEEIGAITDIGKITAKDEPDIEKEE